MKAIIVYAAFENIPTAVATVSASDLGLSDDTIAPLWLDRIYTAMNHGAGNPDIELCSRLHVRSMTVGDMVRFEQNSQTIETYRCDSNGWQVIPSVR